MKTKFNGILTLLLAFVVQVTFAQDKKISGVVSDEMGAMLGVNVVKKGTKVGADTDMEGKYSIKAKAGDVLVFSFMGYHTVEKTVGASSKINVVMKAEATQLEEVVVVAYGTAKKSSVVGSVSTLNKQVLENTKVSNVTKALEGSVSGVQAVAESGQPGEDAQIKIRGVGSINSSNRPLYIVDGVPFDGQISSIAQSDIESLNVLKDAAANSLYGARGANGVVIIKTKRGKKGKIKVTLQGSTGISNRAVEEYDIITDPKEYYEVFWKGLKQKYVAEGKADADAAGLASKNIVKDYLKYNAYNVDSDKLVGVDGKLNPNAKLLYDDSWNDEMFGFGIRKDLNFSVAGGNDKSTYYFSAGYLDDEGYVVSSNFKRYNARLSFDYDITDKFKVNSSLSYANTIKNFPTSSGSGYTNSFQWARSIAPIYPVYEYENGVVKYDNEGNKVYDFGLNNSGGKRPYGGNVNPIAMNKFDINKTTTDNINVNLGLSYEVFKDLFFRYNFGYQVEGFQRNGWQNSKYGYGVESNGSGTRTAGRKDVMTNQQLINWNKTIGKLDLEVLLGHELYELNYEELSGTKEQFLLFEKPVFDMAAFTKSLGSYEEAYAVEGYFGRVKLNLDSKYYLSGSYRRDASSVFHPDNRWGNFWSVGAGWLIHKENFAKDLKWFNIFKIKGSYGTQGNDAILYPDDNTQRNYYGYADQYTVSGNASGQLTSVLRYLGNKELTWEKSKAFNVGFESKFFNRLTLNVDYFKRITSDMLFMFKTPGSLGLPDIPKNIGEMENYGYEIELGVDIIKKENLKWNISINGTSVDNKVTKLVPEFKDGITSGTQLISEGHSIYGFYLVEWAGVNKENGMPQYFIDEFKKDAKGKVIKDANGDPKKTGKRIKTEDYSEASAHRKYVGDALPDLYGGLTSSLKYKNFDLGLQFSYQIGGEVYDGIYGGMLHSEMDGGDNWSRDILNAWSKDNKDSDIPIFQLGLRDVNNRSSRFLTDASYLSFKNITLGYSLTKEMLANKVNDVRIYLSADNLMLWSKRQGLDPRQYSNGTTGNNYSPLRTISLGFNIQF